MARDISAELCDMHPNHGGSVPMYSFDRVAWTFLQALFDGLQEGGATEAQAIAFLQSKSIRHALDADMGQFLRAAGLRYGREVFATEAKEI